MLENPLLDNALMGSSIDQPEEQEQFLIIQASGRGDASNPFLSPPEVYMGTEADLREMYNSSNQLQETFGSFDNYVNYNRDFTASGANWIESAAQVSYRPGTPEWAYVNGEDIAWQPGQKEQIAQQVMDDQKNAYQSAYQQWVMSEDGQSLLSQYGVNPTIYNQDGDQFKFTGTGYQKTYKVDDSFPVAEFVKGMITAVAASGLTGNLAAALNIYGGLSASVAQSIANGVQAVATNGGSLSVGDFLQLGAQMAGLDIPPELGNGEWVNYVQQGILNDAIDYAKDAVKGELPAGEIVWQTPDVSDVLGDVQVQVPDYSQPQTDEEAGGGGAETPAPEAPSTDTTTSAPEMGEPWGWVWNGVGWNPVYSEEEAISLPGNPQISVGAEKPAEDYYGDVVDNDSNAPNQGEQEDQGDFTFGGMPIVVPPTTPSTGAQTPSPSPPTDGTGTDVTSPTEPSTGTDGTGQVPTGDGTEGTGETGGGVDGTGNDGTGEGEGGTGDGDGEEGAGSGGMLSGDGFTPEWGELFAYTPWSPAKGKAIAPYMDYIKQARGMFS